MPFLPMKLKNRWISPKNGLFWGTFHPKTTNFPTRSLHSTNLPAVSGVNTCFTVSADPEIGGWGRIPTHETQNRRNSPPKPHFFRHFSSKKRKFSDQKSAFRPSAPGFKGSHLLHCDRGP